MLVTLSFSLTDSIMCDKVLVFVVVLAFISLTGRSASGLNSTRKYSKQGYSVYEPGWSLINDGSLEVWFRTELKNAMVIYEDVGDQGEFLDVFLDEGRIKMRMAIGDCSYEERIINGSFNDLNWHKLVIRKVKGNTTLSVDDMTVKPAQCSSQFQPMKALYTGCLSLDIRDQSEWAFPTDYWQSMAFSFQGCLKEIKYTDDGVVTRPQLRATKKTKSGCSSPCLKHKCRHGGRCIDRILTAECDCEGTGYQGKHCARVFKKPSSTPGNPTSKSTTTKSTSDVSKINPTKSAPKKQVIAKANRKASGVYQRSSIWTVIRTTLLGVVVIVCIA